MKLRISLIAVASVAAAAALATAGLTQTGQTLSLAGAIPTLDQEFKTAPVWRVGPTQTNVAPLPLTSPSFSWAAGYIWNHAPVGTSPSHLYSTAPFPAWTSNGNADADPNGDMARELGPALSPLIWSGTLDITARPMPATVAATVDSIDPKQYISGAITSFPYSQTFGVFSMSAKVPKGPGLWPAFWLVPADKSWPPEIDIVEILGGTPSIDYTTVHAIKYTHGNGYQTNVDTSAAFHEYTVDWGPETINWYFDNKLVYSQPTPPELHKPCYIIANLAVGKANQWGGAPNETTVFPAAMKIAYIKVWQRPAYLSAK